jgi:3-oxoacyl-[acyl-carrier-protein] synthase-3
MTTTCRTFERPVIHPLNNTQSIDTDYQSYRGIDDQQTRRRGYIRGVGSAIGDQKITNEEIANIVDTSDEWIVKRTGITSRFVCSSKSSACTAELGAAAANDALKKNGIDPEEIDCIICSTFTPDNNFPSTACMIQGIIGAKRAFAFDIAAACTGFIYGLDIANCLIRAERCKNVLLVCSEVTSRVLDWSDRTTCILFGDAAGAVIIGGVGEETRRGILSSHLESCPDDRNALTLPASGERRYISMNGNEVFRRALTYMVDTALVALVQAGISVDDIDLFIPHQANARIISAVAATLGIPPEKTIITVDAFANTGSASIPLAFDTYRKNNHLPNSSTILFSAVGGGFTAGSAIVRY